MEPLDRVMSRLKRDEEMSIEQRVSAVEEVIGRLHEEPCRTGDPAELRRCAQLLEEAADYAEDARNRTEEIAALKAVGRKR